MAGKKNIFAIIGSASPNSANEKLVNIIAELATDSLNIKIFTGLKSLPHFDPQLSADNPPPAIIELREAIANADGVLISSPEYVFSIPSGLKNALEWCVSTTVFSDKPLGLITASLDGQKASQELALIMKTLTANFTGATTLLIPGIRGKMKESGEITDTKTMESLKLFVTEFKNLVGASPGLYPPDVIPAKQQAL